MTSKQIDRALTVLERLANVAERWANAEYPVPNETEEPYVSRPEDRQADADPQSIEEYRELPGRFEEKAILARKV